MRKMLSFRELNEEYEILGGTSLQVVSNRRQKRLPGRLANSDGLLIGGTSSFGDVDQTFTVELLNLPGPPLSLKKERDDELALRKKLRGEI